MARDFSDKDKIIILVEYDTDTENFQLVCILRDAINSNISKHGTEVVSIVY